MCVQTYYLHLSTVGETMKGKSVPNVSHCNGGRTALPSARSFRPNGHGAMKLPLHKTEGCQMPKA
jgi:hypothetical protein